VSIPCRVTYTCTGGTCTRVEAQPTGASPGPAEQVVTGLSSSSVFTYFPNSGEPSEVTLLLTFPADTGDDSITVRDSATFRNPAVVG
jgi:hypothetical protein